ncbi:hypothetical protein [Streptomyces turgidiscabies]|uniref:Uncharacterized protein n=1 Tax=Streptomyces turgidiscabies TaxID=85558 RepID=A0ABU0RYS0_9ACTN|nr:hypothetical protein [Streptomyces turgidiscabies]MDQ0937135.1 hypothetical protein [Streptomyces turgidiscabies]
MPQTSVRPARSDGEFADVFARRARTPLRGFLPGRRVWSAVGGSAAAVVVIAGATALVARIDWSGGPENVTTAAAKKAGATKQGSTKADGARAATTPSAAASAGKDKGPDVVYLPPPGGYGSGTSVGGPASNASGSGSRSGSGSGSGSGTSSGGTAAGDAQKSASQSAGATPQQATPYMSSDGSVEADANNYWDQSVVTVKSTKALSGLKVVVKIIQTGGVANTGTWSSLDDKVSVSSGTSSGELDYVITLKPGVTLEPGTYSFAFQYNHAPGHRDAGGDRYNVTSTSTTSVTEYGKGGF